MTKIDLEATMAKYLDIELEDIHFTDCRACQETIVLAKRRDGKYVALDPNGVQGIHPTKCYKPHLCYKQI